MTAVVAAPGLAAQVEEPFEVEEIRIEGLRRTESATVFAYLPLKRGDVFTAAKASEIIGALYATGFYQDVSVSVDGQASRRTVVVQVVERATISAVTFAGVHEFDKDHLAKALQGSGLASGRFYDRVVAERATRELKRQYLVRGFYATEVSVTATPHDNGRVSLLFSVVEGPSARLRQINFIGNRAFSSGTLAGEMKLATPNWFSWYTKSDLYAKQKLEEDLESLRTFYLDRGYLEFSVDSTQVSMSPDRNDMYLTVALNEGEPYTVSGVQLAGDLLGRDEELARLVKIRAGERFSASRLEATTKALVERLGQYGYAFASVHALPAADTGNHTVALTLDVQPGRRVYVRHVNITGNTRTRDEVVRREIRQLESAWFDSSRVALSKDRINRLGYFTEVDVTTVPVPDTPDLVDVNVRVLEKPTGAITLGAGFSSSDKIVLSAGVSQDNVFGSGTSLSINLNTSQTYRTLAVTQVDPYFTVDGIKRITDVYYRTYEPLYYSTDSSFRVVTAGGDLKFGIPFSEVDTVYFGAGVAQNRLDVDAATPQSYIDYVQAFGTTSYTVPLTAGWARDARDSALVPSRGYFLQANAEYGTPAGNAQYFKADLQGQYYYSFSRGFILGLHLQGGYGQGVGGRPYPVFKNYYAGGIGSVRGYETSSLGPRDRATGDPIGGSQMVTANIELTFPLPGTGYDRTLRVFTFFDGGNVWGTQGTSIGANGLRYGYGAGLAWISPIGPLKMSLGYPLRKQASDRLQRFQFQIGTSF